MCTLQVYQIHATKLEVLAKSPLRVQHRVPPTIPKGVALPQTAVASTASAEVTPTTSDSPAFSSKRKQEKHGANAAGASASKRSRQNPSRAGKNTDVMDE